MDSPVVDASLTIGLFGGLNKGRGKRPALHPAKST